MQSEMYFTHPTIRDRRYSLYESSGPAVEPVSLADQKLFMRVDHTVDNDLITALITVARKEVENYTHRQLITATWVMRMDMWPPDEQIEMPLPPLQSVTSVVYKDVDNVSQTLTANTDYTVDIYRTPGRIVPAINSKWPTPYGHINDITVTFKAGYGDAATTVPAPLIQATKMICAHLYEHREQFLDGVSIVKVETAERLMNHYRIRGEAR